MLYRKELASIPILPPPEPPEANLHRIERLVAVQVLELPKSGNVLVADIYDANTEKLKSRFFSDGKGYCTLENPKFDAFAKHNPGSCYWGMIPAYSTEADTVLAEAFLEKNRRQSWRSHGALAVIDAFVSDLEKDKRDRAEERKSDLQKTHFSMFPALPEDLEEFCERNVFTKGFIFFDKLTKSGRRYAHCGECGEKFRVAKTVKQNQETACPRCGKPAVFRMAWNPGKTEGKANVCICYKVEDQLLIRWTEAHRTYSERLQRKYAFEDYAYNLHLKSGSGKGTVYAYEYRAIPYAGKEWKRLQNGTENFSFAYVYSGNLGEVFGKRYYNVDLKEGLEGLRTPFSLVHLLSNLSRYPAAEYLFKLGMPLLAASSVSQASNQERKFEKLMGVSGQLMELYRDEQVTPMEHQIIRNWGKWVSKDDLSTLRKLKLSWGDSITACRMVERMGFGKFTRYFAKQKAETKRTCGYLMQQYEDYMSMAKTVGVDMSRKGNRFPKNIVTAHDEILKAFLKIKRENEEKVFAEAIGRVYPCLPILQWENAGYRAVLPKKRGDLVAEGASLGHCVGGDRYCNNHMAGERLIVFVRRADAPDKPYFTMEVDMRSRRIVQLHGKGNCSAPKEVRKFAEAFARKLTAKKEEKIA